MITEIHVKNRVKREPKSMNKNHEYIDWMIKDTKLALENSPQFGEKVQYLTVMKKVLKIKPL